MAMQRQGRGVAGRGNGRAEIPAPTLLARLRRHGQPVRGPQPQPQLLTRPAEHEYAFLVGTLLDRTALARAEAEAAQCGVATHDLLVATGQVSQLDYAAALGRWLGVPVVAWNAPLDLADAAHEPATDIGLPARLAGRPCRVLAATDAGPAFLATQVAVLRAQGVEVLLAPRMLIHAALEARARPERIEQAARGLLRRQPASSAGAPVATWQQMAGVGLAGLLIGGLRCCPTRRCLP
jgi:hypothetical protein